MKLLFATRNQGKLRELRALLADLDGLQLLCLDDLPQDVDVEETGASFAENAQIKAQAAMRATGLPALADDSGLEVDALSGAPGVHSARYAGPGATDGQRNDKLLRELADVPADRRTARFRCAVAFVHPAQPGLVQVREAACEGTILTAPRGAGGFGYDPLFYVPQLGQTFAEAPPEAKNRLSHRGQAMRKLAQLLRDRIAG